MTPVQADLWAQAKRLRLDTGFVDARHLDLRKLNRAWFPEGGLA